MSSKRLLQRTLTRRKQQALSNLPEPSRKISRKISKYTQYFVQPELFSCLQVDKNILRPPYIFLEVIF